jgi:hypothetical protein
VSYEGKYIDSAKLMVALTPETFLACFDDENTGDVNTVDDEAVQLAIDGAEGEVDSYMITARPQPLPSTTSPAVDRIVERSCLEFAMSLAWERHPEYVRTYGENPRATALWDRATKRMERVKEGRQELPDVDEQNGRPSTLSPVVFDEGPRTITTSADGTENGSGF